MAAKRRLSCPKCGRLFALPAHLGRHLKTTHGSQSSVAASRKTVPTRRPIPRARARAAQPQTNSAFGAVIASLRTARDQAAAELTRLGVQLAALDGALTALSVDANSESRPRPPAVDRPRSPMRGRAKRGTVILGILEALAQKGPLKPALVAATAGAKPTTVSTALDTLRKKKLAARGAAGWELTAAGRADLAQRQKSQS